MKTTPVRNDAGEIVAAMEISLDVTHTKQLEELVIEKTKQYHDGKWVWIRLENNSFENDICNLIKIKKKPQKG